MKNENYNINVKKIISTIFIILCVFNLIKISNYFNNDENKIKNVYLDQGTMKWDKEYGVINLKGKVIFYKNALIPYGSFVSTKHDYIDLSSNLNDFYSSTDNVKRGTYNIKIIDLDDSMDYAIYLKKIYTSYRVFVNGRLIYENGFFDDGKAKGRLQKKLIKLKPIDGEINIWIQIFNDYGFRKSGIVGDVKFGPCKEVIKYKNWEEDIDNILIGTIFTISLISSLIYIFNRSNDIVFYFFILSLFISIESMIERSMAFSMVFDKISFIFEEKLEMIIVFFLVYFMYAHFYYFYENTMSKSWFKRIRTISIVSSIVIILIPFQYINIIWVIEVLYCILYVLYQIYFLYTKWRLKDRYAGLNLIGFIGLGVSATYDLLASLFELREYSILSIGWIFMLIIQIIIMSLKESNVYQDLEIKLDERTKMIQENENILNKAQEIAHMGSWCWSVKNKKITYTKGLKKLYDLEDKEYSYKELYEKLIPDFIQEFYEQNKESKQINVESFFGNEKIYISKDGSERWMKLEGDIILGEQGEINLIIGNIQDITDLKIYRDYLKKTSITDPLTRIYNRIKINEDIKFLINLYNENEGVVFSILIIDIDDFKLVNDKYGHIVGDKVLVELVNLIKSKIRKEDIFARWGGEEFMILIPDKDIDTAFDIAEKLRSEIQNHDFKIIKKLTASFGVSEFKKEDDIESLTNRADVALYEAKSRGKNMVIKKN